MTARRSGITARWHRAAIAAGALALPLAAAGIAAPPASAADTYGVTATIPVGNSPQGVAVAPSTHIAYVANATDNTVSVIDEATNTVTATIPVGSDPDGVAVDPAAGIVYVTNVKGDTVSVIDATTNIVTATIPVGHFPKGVAVDPATGTVYVANYGGFTVSVISEANNTVTATIPLGALDYPFGVAVDPSAGTVYVTNYDPSYDTVSVIDATTNIVTATIPVGSEPEGVAVDPSARTLYVANGDSSTVSVISEATNTVTATIPLGGVSDYPEEVAVDPSAGTVYVTNAGAYDTVSVIDAATNTVEATVPVDGAVPEGVAVDPSTSTAYAAGDFANAVFVISKNPVSLSFPAPPSGEVGLAYSDTLPASGGVAPYAWSVSAGALPAGMTLGASSGVLSGTPTVAGTFSFTVEVTLADNQSAAEAVSLVIAPTVSLSFPAPPSGEVGVAYSDTLPASGGMAPYAWSVSAGALPAGMTLGSATGTLSGTPAATGTSTFTVQVTDAGGQSATEATALTIISGPALSFPTPPSGEYGAAYSDTLAASGGTGPYTWSVSSGSPPAGIYLGSATGTLSGTPAATGTSNFTVQVTDADGQSATEATTLTIISGPALSWPTPPSGEIGAAYSDTLTASGGTGPYTWSVSGGLPAGITLGSTTGTLAGTPTATGSFTFPVKVTDADNQTATEVLSLVIAPAVSLSFPAPPSGQAGVAYSDYLSASAGVAPYAWSVSAGALPAGMTLGASSGVLSGTPTVAGTFSLTVQVTDADDETATEAVSLVIAPSVALSASASSVTFGTTVTLTATVAPAAATGSVVFADKLSSGPQSGQVVTLGTVALLGGTAALTADLPAFNTNTVTATYSGDATYAGTTSAPAGVRVTAYSGEVLVDEFRLSGPGGATDQYAELYNAGPPVSLGGFTVAPSTGTSTTVPASAPVLPTGGAYLITSIGYTLSAVAGPDTDLDIRTRNGYATLGSAGLKVTAPDGLGTVTDAVGSAGAGTGYYSGTALPALSGTPADQYAWVRVEAAGVPGNTGNNAADFQLVSTTGAVVGGIQSALGSPSPRDTGSPGRANGVLQSALLDPARPVTAAPNFVYVHGTPGLLTIRRTLTNSSPATITAAEVRITSLSEANGPPEPGATTQPPAPAQFRVINPATPTSTFTITNGQVVTVQNLSVNSPASYSPATPSTGGGGIDTTLTIPLPSGGLIPGASVSIALSFAVDRHGPYWYGYDVDALATASLPIGGARAPAPAAALIPPRPPGPMSRQATARALRYADGRGILP